MCYSWIRRCADCRDICGYDGVGLCERNPDGQRNCPAVLEEGYEGYRVGELLVVCGQCERERNRPLRTPSPPVDPFDDGGSLLQGVTFGGVPLLGPIQNSYASVMNPPPRSAAGTLNGINLAGVSGVVLDAAPNALENVTHAGPAAGGTARGTGAARGGRGRGGGRGDRGRGN
jgi:hypothetical protein